MQRLICKPSAFSRAASSYDAAACVQKDLAGTLLERFLTLANACAPGAVFEVGCGTGQSARILAGRLCPEHLYVNDVARGMLEKTQEALAGSGTRVTVLAGDAESIDWPEELDAVLSFSAVQWFKTPLSVVDRAYCALNAGGRVVISTFLPGTLAEVTDFTGCALRYPDEDAWRMALEHGFELEHFAASTHQMTFESPRAVLRHLQATGAAGGAAGFRWSTARLAQFESDYRAAHAAPEGGVRLTYRALQFIARKRGLNHGV